jgi:hypothetical protein
MANQLLRYLNQIPEDFEMSCKVWEEITIPRFASHARYGVKAGQPNPRFLDAKLFNEMVLTPYRDAKFEPHTGPFLFEFQRHDLSPGEFTHGWMDSLGNSRKISVMRLKFATQASWDLNIRRFSIPMGLRMSTTIGPTCLPWQSNTSGWGASRLPSLC